tara:strand:- start:7436 stop:9436 length:2001 start_codon:yes stop_codon:yes gene_type:complete
MAQSKRNFQSAQMNKDLDDRLVPPGSYRDALNVSVAFSEDGNVGALENLKGNELLLTQNIIGLSAASNPNAEVIGSIAHPEENKIYYFVTGDNTDGIFEYDFSTTPPRANTIIIDSSTPPPAPELLNFTFANAGAQASVAVNGAISLTSSLGEIESITQDFNETVAANTLRTISAKVRVPNGYSNTNDYVNGTLTATQQAIAAPIATSITVLEPTLITANTATLNGRYTQDAASLTDIGFYYAPNTGGSSTVNLYSNKIVVNVLQGGSANISSGSPNWTDPFEGVPSSDVTVIDGNGNVVSSSNYVYEQHFGPQPSTIEFISSFSATLPVTVAQTSTLTTINNALTSSQIVSSGTQVSLAGAITSPFNAPITGLSPGTEHATVAYVTNSLGTTFSDVLTFSTTAGPSVNRPPNNHLFIVQGISSADGPPTASEIGVDARNVGYGDWEKADGNYYFNTFATSSTGIASNNPPANASVLSSTGVSILTAGSFAALDNKYVLGSSLASGQYTFTASLAGQTSHAVQIVTSSNAVRTATFSLNFASTGTGTTPFLAQANSNSYQYNFTPNTPAVFKIGPYESSFTTPGVIVVPIATSFSGTFGAFGSFDATKLDVSITGKTAGTDYDYYICDTGPAIFGVVPAVIISANPNTINNNVSNVTHTLNITYNY